MPSQNGLPKADLLGMHRNRFGHEQQSVNPGGLAMGKLPPKATEATMLAEFGSGALKPDQVADLALGGEEVEQ